MEYNPFADNSYNLQFVAFQLSEILKMGVGFDCRDLVFLPDEQINGVAVKEANDNPFLIDRDGKEMFYQRDLVWELSDKVNLIDAMYNYSDIGKFVVVRNGYDHLQMMIKMGHTKGLSFHELVDGKQRLNAIIEFMQDKFKDSNDMLYSEMSNIAKRMFRSYNKCTIAILDNATPEVIQRAFLNVNHTGKAMSKEHIDFIKSLNV